MSSGAPDRPVVAIVSASPADRPPALEPLAGRAEVRYAESLADLQAAFADADVLLVTDFRTGIVHDAWPAARRLRWVHATSAGVDALVFPALVESGVTLTNAAGLFDESIAEYVAGLILAYAKDFFRTFRLQQQRRWLHRDTERVGGKRLLVVGAGSIGTAIARRASALGLRVTGVARSARHTPPFETVRAQPELPELLSQADYVVLAAPLTAETRHMIGAAELALMKPTARLINIGRGALVDTAALVDAVRAERIAGAALDVFEREPLPADHPLWELPNVLVSPHMSGDFLGWREALSRQFLDNFERYVRNETLRNVVDKTRFAA